MPDHDNINRGQIILQEIGEIDEFHGLAPALKSGRYCMCGGAPRKLRLPFDGYCDIQSPSSLDRSRICCGTCDNFDLGPQGRKGAQKR
jgi:hypothetical protein